MTISPSGTPASVRRAVVATLLLTVVTTASAQIGGKPGAFSRMGFGARGMGMGNAMTAVTTGDIESYYNPALLPLQQYRHAAASMGFLQFDRSLNFLSFGQVLPPDAGIAAGVINAGVKEIDGRDSDGQPTGPLRTSENQAFLGFGIRFKPGFSLGLNIKLLYYQLYTDVSSTTVGVDIGFAWPVTQDVIVAATVRDIASKYKWDTSPIYDQQGQTSEERFPQLYTVAASWSLPDSVGIVAGELEFSSAQTTVARIGAEIRLIPELSLRGGIDRVDLRNEGNGIKPSLGFTARKDFQAWVPALQYAYIFEPFAPSGIHMISLSVMF